MGLASIWKNYKVVIVMGTGIGLIHWSWVRLQSNPYFNPTGESRTPSYVKFILGKDKDANEK